MNYRLVEVAPEDGQRYGKRKRTTIFTGTDKEALKQAIEQYHKQPRKPWAETSYYHGARRIYAYEL